MLLDEAGEAWKLVTRAIATFGESIAVIDSSERSVTISCTAAGVAHGLGVRFWPEGDVAGRLEYAGTFVDGRRDGYGVMFFADKTQYEGGWESGRTSGYGRESYPDGSSYGGQFHANARHGLGTYTDHSQNKFAGLWEEGSWGRGVEEEEQPQLEAVMAYSAQTSAQAVEISERVEVLRQLRLHLPSTFRGPILMPANTLDSIAELDLTSGFSADDDKEKLTADNNDRKHENKDSFLVLTFRFSGFFVQAEKSRD